MIICTNSEAIFAKYNHQEGFLAREITDKNSPHFGKMEIVNSPVELTQELVDRIEAEYVPVIDVRGKVEKELMDKMIIEESKTVGASDAVKEEASRLENLGAGIAS